MTRSNMNHMRVKFSAYMHEVCEKLVKSFMQKSDDVMGKKETIVFLLVWLISQRKNILNLDFATLLARNKENCCRFTIN